MSDVASTEFARLMARCGPFEPRPLLGVAVSGGADSMALALLADEWARAQSGRVVALTVDHGLRPEAPAEARAVARWMKRRGIAHRVLAWRGTKPATGIQAAAREARYRLLGERCRADAALHLLLGHTRDDQAETVLLRLASGSGPRGLAAMPLAQETAAVRVLRPLLGVERARLRATLRARDQQWIEDPSNCDDRFARVRVRRMLAAAREGELQSARLAAAALELGRLRASEERRIAGTLARAVTLYPEGYARVDVGAVVAAPPELGWRALAALLATIGGLAYAPRVDAVRALHADLCAGRIGGGRTLARCRLIPEVARTQAARCLVVRETRGIEIARPGTGSKRFDRWDGRFDLELSPARKAVEIAALGAAGWAEAVARAGALRATPIPYAARLGLPALRDRSGVLAVPSLGFRRERSPKKTPIAAFRPRGPLAPAVFAAPTLP